MPWKFEAQGGNFAPRDFATEGNVDVYVFQKEVDSVRLLILPWDAKEYAKKEKIGEEEAMERFHSTLIYEDWYMPIPHWEHTIKAEQGKRGWGVAACYGLDQCSMCAENREAEANGVTENRMKPYPIRKRYTVPIWSYRLERVLYLKQNQQFMEELSPYIDKHGVNIRFDLHKTGMGLQTQYKAIFDGPVPDDETLTLDLIKPSDLDFRLSAEDLKQKLGELPQFPPQEAGGTQVPASTSESKGDTTTANGDTLGSFVVPFGSHKGKTVDEIYETGNLDWLKMAAEKGSGVVKDKVEAYLKEKGEL